MSAVLQAGWIGPEEYLIAELKSQIRREYVGGLCFPVPDSTVDHSRIVGNLLGELMPQLRGTACEPFSIELKVKLQTDAGVAFYYPDVMVACDPAETAEYYRERPSVIFEVLSPDTERTDRREKALAHRHIPTLEFYVLVQQDALGVTLMRRAEPGWTTEVVQGRNAVLKLPSIGVEIPLNRIYERTTLSGT